MDSLFGRKLFPVPVSREFACKALGLLGELKAGIAKMAINLENSLLFSLLSGNS